jgi:hypothetical protein
MNEKKIIFKDGQAGFVSGAMLLAARRTTFAC